jgi:HSP20 family molecular chaperone IbpA
MDEGRTGMSTVAIQRASTPTALTQSLYDYMNEIYNRVAQRAFSFFESNGRTHGHDLEDWLKAEAEFLNPVPLELSETDTELAVRAELPGFTEKELEIVAEPGRLFITGKSEKKSEEKKKKTLFSEISSNEIFRSIYLPAEIDPEKVSAVLKNGILEISMHKAKPAKKVTVMAKAA